MTTPTPQAVRVSVVIIAFNEADNIVDCLKSAAWADETVVIDSGSTDATADLCRQHGAKLVVTDWPGFGVQKNRAIDAASGDWIFSLDADERITPQLAQEIRSTIEAPRFEVYDVPRRSHFLGKAIAHSGWWPDRTPRLFRRGAARFSTPAVHERLEWSRPIGHLQQCMLHYGHRRISDVLAKTNAYSSASAQELMARGKRGSVAAALSHASWAFLRAYVLRRGFLDGAIGIVLALSIAETAFYKWLKLAELQGRLAPGTHPTPPNPS